MDMKTMIPLLIPIVLINLTLVVFAMVDLVKRKKVRFDNKMLWGAIILFISYLGPILYFVLGRKDEE